MGVDRKAVSGFGIALSEERIKQVMRSDLEDLEEWEMIEAFTDECIEAYGVKCQAYGCHWTNTDLGHLFYAEGELDPETGDMIRNNDQVAGLKRMIKDFSLTETLAYHEEVLVY